MKEVRITLKNGYVIAFKEPELKLYVTRSEDGYLRLNRVNKNNIGIVLIEVAPGEWSSWETLA